MAQCANCEGLRARRVFAAPDDYRAFVAALIDLIKQGKLKLVRGDCPLEAMLTPPWPDGGDTFAHELQCGQCYGMFELCVNTWNGRNWWEPSPWQAR
jgi:hypothetical protein